MHLLPKRIIFNMEGATSIESKTSFNCLPTEIIFIIFDYLSSNDIIYAFFFLNQRLNNLLLQNQRYSNYFELPTTNLDTWEIILSIIGSQIKCLNIMTIELPFPLRYFPNLKSLIISSQYGLSEEILKYIIENDIFQNLSSFKIKQQKIFPNPYLADNVIYEDKIFKNVFNQNNSLEIFQYSLMVPPSVIYTDNLQINFNLHSLTLVLSDFRTIFVVIRYTPNLKYLNVKTRIPFGNAQPIDKINIKLKQLHLTLNKLNEYANIDVLIDGIKQFSSSLIYLSLDLVDYSVRGINEFSLNSLKLPQLLESMKELKQFHFYAKLSDYRITNDIILSQFKDQHWFNHNSSFGMYDNFLYTLPFHFDNLYECFQDFSEVKLNNCEILENNSRIWYNVKSIQLPVGSNYNRNFVKELKTKMPKLTLIRFDGYGVLPKIYTHDSSENKDVTLDNVTTIQFMRESIEHQKDWIVYSLPKLRHLILSHYTTLPSIDSELAPILNKKIQRLDIDAHRQVKELTEINYVYFSNVQNINFFLSDGQKSPECYGDIIIKMLKNFKSLKILMIRSAHLCHKDGELSFPEKNWAKIIEYFNMNEMHKTYQVKYLKEYTLFLKKSFQI